MALEKLDGLERRVVELEERNRALEEQLEEGRSLGLSRRQLFTLLGGGALFGAASQPAAAESSPWADSDGDGLLETPNYDGIEVATTNTAELSISGWNWVDMVDAGADPTGVEDTSPIITAELTDNTTLVFPDGTYHMGSQIDLEYRKNVSFVGRGDATFKVDSAFSGVSGRMFHSPFDNPATNIVFKNIDYDLTANDVGFGYVGGLFNGLLVEDVDVFGEWDQVSAPSHLFSVYGNDITRPVILRRVRAPDGSVHATELGGTYDDQPVCFFSGGDPDTTLVFKDCVAMGWANNGIYASDHGGRVIVDGGYYVNNDHSQVRVSGQSTIRNVYAAIDPNLPSHDSTYESGRCIWINKETDGQTLVENCHLVVSDNGTQCIRVTDSASGLFVTNTKCVANSGGTPILINAYTGTFANPKTVLDNVSVEGSPTSNNAIVSDRDGVIIRDCYIDLDTQTTGVNGIYIRDGADNSIVRPDIDVPGDGILIADADCRITEPRISASGTEINDSGTRTRVNGVGTESASAETPTAADWDTGDIVDFTDSGDGSGDGVYLLLPDGTWSKMGS